MKAKATCGYIWFTKCHIYVHVYVCIGMLLPLYLSQRYGCRHLMKCAADAGNATAANKNLLSR